MRGCARSISAGRIMAEALLALDGVRAGYGDAVVLDGIAFEVLEGGSLALLGRNGVGKTTLLLTIMGFTRVSRGTIAWRASAFLKRKMRLIIWRSAGKIASAVGGCG